VSTSTPPALDLTVRPTPPHSISDVTAIWNTNAFFAYLISVKAFSLKWQPIRLVAVSFATLGVVAVVYGGSTSSPPTADASVKATDPRKDPIQPRAPLVGDLLTLIASVGYGLYQVLYKKYIAMPFDPETKIDDTVSYTQIPEEPPTEFETPADLPDVSLGVQGVVYPPPFGLYPNLVTSGIGLCTLLVLWVPLPILHVLGAEPFSLPTNLTTVAVIAGIASGGVVFNAGLMVGISCFSSSKHSQI
jgi:drug/metabolite transporter (DMT)-like permease